MSTPLYDGLLSEVLAGAHTHRDRLATARAGVDRLHGATAADRCTTCGTPYPCATRRLVDGLARGDLDETAARALVEAELQPAPGATADPAGSASREDPVDPGIEVHSPDDGPQVLGDQGARPADPADPTAPAADQPGTAAVGDGPPQDPAGPVDGAPSEPPQETSGPQSPVAAYPSVSTRPGPPAVDPEAPARPLPRMPLFADLLEVGRTSRALDVLLGRRPHT